MLHSWKHYKKLHLKKYRQQWNSFLVEGKRLCWEAIDSGWPIEAAFISDTFRQDPGFSRFADLLEIRSMPITELPEGKFKQLSDTDTPQGILLVMKQPARPSTEIDRISAQNIVLLLAGVRDPGNLGTIIRTADWFGIREIFSSADSVDFFNLKTVRAAMGSLFHLNCTECEDLSRFIGSLKEVNFTIVGTSPQSGTTLDQVTVSGPVAIILGGEAEGISPALKALLDQEVMIRKHGRAESLNVAVAAGIILNYFVNRISERRF